MLKIAVAGVGRIGTMHAEIIARQTANAQLVAVADINENAAKSIAGQLQVEHATVDQLFSASNIDAIAICTSTDTHVELIEKAAKAGKAIFCEKPLSLDVEKVDQSLRAIDAANVPFMVGFNRRFDPGHKSVRDAVQSKSIGGVHVARITSRDPAPPPIEYIKVSGGIFMDMTIHDFDMARYVVGSPVVEVFAMGAVLVDPRIGEAGDIDTAVVTLKHLNGAMTVIDNSRQAVYGYDQRVEVFGSAGMAISDNPRSHNGSVFSETKVQDQNLPYFFLERYTASYINEWAAFVEYVLNGGPSPVSGLDGKAPVILGLAAKESVRTGNPVKVDGV